MNYITEGELSRIMLAMSALSNIDSACTEIGIEQALVSFEVSVYDANGETLGSIGLNPDTGTYVLYISTDDE